MIFSRKIKEMFDNYCKFLEKFDIVDREKIKKFNDNKPNFVVYGGNFPTKEEKKVSALFQPENNTIFLNAEYLVWLSFFFEENSPYLPAEKSFPIIMSYYVGEESSHALINFLHPKLLIRTQKFMKKWGRKEYTPEEVSKMEFLLAKDEALARSIAKNYSANVYGTSAESLVKRMYELEALDWMEELSVEEVEEHFDEIMEKSKIPFRWVGIYSKELEYTLDETRKLLKIGLEKIINPREKKLYQAIKEENRSIRELTKKFSEFITLAKDLNYENFHDRP